MQPSLPRTLITATALLLGCALPSQAYDLRTKALVPVDFKTAPVHAKLPLVKDGKLNVAIAFDHQLETRGYWDQKSIRPAVDVLKEAFLNCTGQTLEVIDTNDQAAMARHPYLILLGDSAPARKLGINFMKLPRQGYEVRSFDRGIAIVGNDSSIIEGRPKNHPLRGTLWGAYDFIERFLGCRFYFPGPLGSVWPKTDNLMVEPVNYIDSPRFQTRDHCWIYWTMADHKKIWEPLLGTYRKGTHYPDKVPFYERWRMANTVPFWASHNPRPEKFSKAYPDKLDTIFYRAPNGNFYHTPNQHHGNYFDILNLRFADLLVESLKKYYKSNGKLNDGWDNLSQQYIAFGQCDLEVPLPDMINHPTVIREKLITPENLKRGDSYSDIYGRFYQYLGNRIKQELPGKKLALLPYSNYTQAPLDPRWTLPDNVELRVCVYGMAKIRDPKVAAHWKKIIDDWAKALGNRPVASIWLYNVPGNQFARAIAPMMVKDVIKLFGKNLGDIDVFHDQYGPLEWWNYCANYVHARTTWSEDFDGMAAIDEHWELMYGPKAAPYLREFFQLVYDAYMKYFVPNPERDVLYPPAVIDRLDALLKKAESVLPPDSIERKRFKVFAYPWPKAFDTQRNLMSYERPVYGAYQLLDDETVTVDGKAESFWAKVRPIPMLDPRGSNEKPKTPVSIKLAWNKQGLYCLANLPYKPVPNATKPVWFNDGIEVLFSPTLKEHHLFHLSVDALGREYFGTREFHPVAKPYGKWKCRGFKSAVLKTGDASWNVEFFLPFSAMSYPPPKVYDCWKMNMVHNRKSNDREFAGSAITQGHNMNLKMYGLIKFLGKGE